MPEVSKSSVFAVAFFAVSWRKLPGVLWSQRHYRGKRGQGYRRATLCGLVVPSDTDHELSDGLPAAGLCDTCIKIMREIEAGEDQT